MIYDRYQLNPAAECFSGSGSFHERKVVDAMSGAVRAVSFSIIRAAHVRLLSKPLPRKIAIYFHELEPDHWRAFEECITYFTSLGYQPADPHQFATDGSARQLLFASFDDNFSGWHAALPLFAKLKLTATFYVNSLPFRDKCDHGTISDYFERIAYLGKDAPLSSPELRDLAEAGHTIGCHSHSHFRLSRVPEALWNSELAKSKRLLEEIVGLPVADFSFPYGMRRFFSPKLRDYCAGVGFRTIATGIPGLQQIERVDPLALHRTRWRLTSSLEQNLEDLRVDGRYFERCTGLSPVG